MDTSVMPSDFNEMWLDDLLLDALGHPECAVDALPRGGVEGELARILATWRLAVRTAPLRDLVDTDTALAALAPPPKASRFSLTWDRFSLILWWTLLIGPVSFLGFLMVFVG